MRDTGKLFDDYSVGFVRQPAADMMGVVMSDALAFALQFGQLPGQPPAAERALHLAGLPALCASDLGVQPGSGRHGIDRALTVGGLAHIAVQSDRALCSPLFHLGRWALHR